MINETKHNYVFLSISFQVRSLLLTYTSPFAVISIQLVVNLMIPDLQMLSLDRDGLLNGSVQLHPLTTPLFSTSYYFDLVSIDIIT